MTAWSPSWLRAHWWGVAAACSALFVLGLTICLLVGAGGVLANTWLDDMTETVAALTAGCAAMVAAGRNQGRHRLGWGLMSASAIAWGCGQLVWDWYELIAGVSAPFPSPADAGYLLAVPLAIAGVLSFPIAYERARSMLHTLLDGMLIAAALLLVSWDTVLGAVYRAGSGDALGTVLGIAYPVSDVAIITMLLVRVGRSPRRGRLALLLLAAGLATIAVSDSSFAYFTATNTFNSGNVLDAGWVAGYLLVALAAVHAGSHPVREAPPLTVASRPLQYLPYPPVAAALGVIIAQRVTSDAIDVFTFWTMLAIVVFVLVRQYLALGANVRLVGSLAAREREMAYQAHHDALTGLPNRGYFQESVRVALQHHDQEAGGCAVLFIDLDDFKQINDTAGHATGDRVLRLVAGRIRANLRPDDVAARLGGDEFAVLVENPRDQQQLEAMAGRILSALREPAAVDGRTVSVCGTLGIAVSGGGGATGEELLRRADVAMYNGKRAGKDRLAFFRDIAAA